MSDMYEEMESITSIVVTPAKLAVIDWANLTQ